MSAWCHGAPGIGLSRLRAFELLNKEEYKNDIEKAIHQTYKTTVEPGNIKRSYTLCHGGGGNAILFLEAYRQLGESKYLEYAEKVAENGLEYIQKYKKYSSGFTKTNDEDHSLFMGNAGIGYFYLQLLEPLTTPSILKPDVGEISKTPFDIKHTNIHRKLAEYNFSKTLSQAHNFKLEEESDSLQQNIIASTESIVNTINDKRITSIFNYEKQKLVLENAIESYSYIGIKKTIETENNEEFIAKLDGKTLLSHTYKMNENTLLFNSEWNCLKPSIIKKEDCHILIMADSDIIKEHELSAFSYFVLNGFKTPKNAREVLNEIIDLYQVTSVKDKKTIEESLISQIKEALRSVVLVKC